MTAEIKRFGICRSCGSALFGCWRGVALLALFCIRCDMPERALQPSQRDE